MCDSRKGAPFGEQVTQSMPSGNGFVPLVSMQIYFPALCNRSMNVWSIQSEGSPPVKIMTFEGKTEIVCKISSSDIRIPSSCRVSQKLHFRLHPEKRTKTAGVEAFALKTVEYFVNLSHRSLCLLLIPALLLYSIRGVGRISTGRYFRLSG